MSWKSFALWPSEVYTNKYGEHISEDTHATESQALAVSSMLACDGFGGDKQHFPISTWVEEVQELPASAKKLSKFIQDEYIDNPDMDSPNLRAGIRDLLTDLIHVADENRIIVQERLTAAEEVYEQEIDIDIS